MMNFAFFGTNNQKIIYSPTYVMVDKATALQIAKENPEAHFIAAPEETDNGTDKASITPES